MIGSLTARAAHLVRPVLALVAGGLLLAACDSATPSIPTPTDVTASSLDGAVRIEWNPGDVSPERAGYYIYRDTSSIQKRASDLRLGGLKQRTAYVDSTVTNGTTYHYRLVGVSDGGTESPMSEEVTATPIPDPSRP